MVPGREGAVAVARGLGYMRPAPSCCPEAPFSAPSSLAPQSCDLRFPLFPTWCFETSSLPVAPRPAWGQSSRGRGRVPPDPRDLRRILTPGFLFLST